jgi:hypothetical protein
VLPTATKPPPQRQAKTGRDLDKQLKLSKLREERLKTVSGERRRLWEALADYIRLHGGFVTSHPYASPIRIEAPYDSSLPEKLREFGYAPSPAGSVTRIDADIRQFNVWLVSLPR